MKREIDHAVGVFHRIALGTKDGNPDISDRKLRSFVAVLTELLLARYEKNWYPDNPDRGSGYRCIRINRQCIDPNILKSLKESDIDINTTLRSQELTIWVDPGVVSIRIGEEGSVGTEVVDEELYQRTHKGIRHGSIGSESDASEPSSRSQSPQNDSVNSSPSRSSPPLMTRSKSPGGSPPPPSFVQPPQEWNPYGPPTRVINPTYQPNLPLRQQSPPQYPSRNASPPSSTHQYINSSVRHLPRNMAPGPSPMMSKQNVADYIPSHHPSYSYSRPRNLFPASGDFESMPQGSVDHYGKLAFNPYAMPVNYGGSIPQGNFTDIPAMA